MKILYTAVDIPVPGTHGGSVHTLELCRALSRRGHEVHLAAPGPSARSGTHGTGSHIKFAEKTGLDGVILHRLRKPARFLEWRAADAIRQFAMAVSPDVVIERFYTFGGAGLRTARALKIPAVLEVNSPARPYPGSWRDRLDRWTLVRPVDRWRRRLLSWSDAVYTTSKHLLPPDREATARVVVNGVDTTRFRPGPPSPATGPLRCVYVSSFRSWHGAEDLVRAVSICAANGVELQVTCIGRGPRWSAARDAARRAGLEQVIEFTGEVTHDEVPRRLARVEVGLAPFTPAAFSALQLGWFWSPIKIFEYLAAGLAVVTVDMPELRELLPGKVACFYTTGAPQELAAMLRQLASDRGTVRQMGQVARQLAEFRYTWDHQAASVEELLQAVLTRKRK